MAGRFLFQKLASRMSGLTSLLGAHASAPVTRRASDGGIRTLHNLFSGASAHPSTPFLNIEGIHGSPARYLSTCDCIPKFLPPKFLPPVITSTKKPALVDYVRVKRHFSTSPSAKDTVPCEQHLSAREPEWQARLEANRAATKAECAARDAEWKARDAAFDRFMTMMVGSWTVISLVAISSFDSESSCGATVSVEGQKCSHCHSSVSSANTAQHRDVQ